MMKKILVVILFSVFCVNAFSQNVVKEYWENGNLKFERKNVRIDSIYIYDSNTDVSKLEIMIAYDSISFYSKEGKEIAIDLFIKKYGEYETNTKQEKKDNLKRIKDDSITEVLEIKRLDKLVLATKMKNRYLDESLVNIKMITGNKDVCGKVIPGIPETNHFCARPILTIYTTQATSINFFTVINADLRVKYKQNDTVYIKILSNSIPLWIRSFCSKIENNESIYYEFYFRNIYLKDKNENYFKIDEYKNFKLFCEK
jgi:hypothetical protein